MQRKDADPSNMQVEDFICDFSGRSWDGTFPMVEGHQGSLISGHSLEAAYRSVVLDAATSLPPGSYECTMCLETREESCWQSPVRDEAVICRRCILQSATKLEKDADWGWSKPT